MNRTQYNTLFIHRRLSNGSTRQVGDTWQADSPTIANCSRFSWLCATSVTGWKHNTPWFSRITSLCVLLSRHRWGSANTESVCDSTACKKNSDYWWPGSPRSMSTRRRWNSHFPWWQYETPTATRLHDRLRRLYCDVASGRPRSFVPAAHRRRVFASLHGATLVPRSLLRMYCQSQHRAWLTSMDARKRPMSAIQTYPAHHGASGKFRYANSQVPVCPYWLNRASASCGAIQVLFDAHRPWNRLTGSFTAGELYSWNCKAKAFMRGFIFPPTINKVRKLHISYPQHNSLLFKIWQ